MTHNITIFKSNIIEQYNGTHHPVVICHSTYLIHTLWKLLRNTFHLGDTNTVITTHGDINMDAVFLPNTCCNFYGLVCRINMTNHICELWITLYEEDNIHIL